MNNVSAEHRPQPRNLLLNRWAHYDFVYLLRIVIFARQAIACLEFTLHSIPCQLFLWCHGKQSSRPEEILDTTLCYGFWWRIERCARGNMTGFPITENNKNQVHTKNKCLEPWTRTQKHYYYCRTSFTYFHIAFLLLLLFDFIDTPRAIRPFKVRAKQTTNNKNYQPFDYYYLSRHDIH